MHALLRLRSAAVLAATLSCVACISVSGPSSGKMKKELQRSYLVLSAKRFFPDRAVPDDPSLISPELKGDKLKPIQKELSELSEALQKMHQSRRSLIEAHDLPLVAKVSPRIAVVNAGSAAAHTRANGLITVDARVLQSIFRGAVLEIHRGGSRTAFASFPAMASEFDDSFDPRLATAEQREAITKLLETVRTIDEMKARTAIGDAVGIVTDDDFNSPWFRMADIVMQSNSLQTRYLGAVLFLLAHEQGHLALDHFAKRDELEREPRSGSEGDTAYCSGLRKLELEADAYALLLLSPHTSPSAGAVIAESFNEFSDIVGFRNFFVYGYNLSGFAEDEHESCTYETNRSRYDHLHALNEALVQGSADAFDAVLTESVNRAVSGTQTENQGEAR